jgi:hypothetical protein
MGGITKIILGLTLFGAATVWTTPFVLAQYYYPPPPPYYYGGGANCYAGGCCPPGMTIQGGECRPYQGQRYYGGYYGGGRRTYNGCPPHYTIQDGVCKPYRGY